LVEKQPEPLAKSGWQPATLKATGSRYPHEMIVLDLCTDVAGAYLVPEYQTLSPKPARKPDQPDTPSRL
ncbi:MAG TPA: hypothetical protein PK297_09735, partial [Spirochaetota bacterium]|nr:hypothetical protein [Spirochaetota bacterium]